MGVGFRVDINCSSLKGTLGLHCIVYRSHEAGTALYSVSNVQKSHTFAMLFLRSCSVPCFGAAVPGRSKVDLVLHPLYP